MIYLVLFFYITNDLNHLNTANIAKTYIPTKFSALNNVKLIMLSHTLTHGEKHEIVLSHTKEKAGTVEIPAYICELLNDDY